MNPKNPRVEFFFAKAKVWRKELEELRRIALECPLTEEVKWGVPCYVHEKSNVVLIHQFKDYCALLFFKGALLEDPKGILVRQTKNVQSARQIRFTDLPEIVEMEPILKKYIQEAVKVEKAGLKVKFKKTSEFEMPEEFQHKLESNAALKTAFGKLTPGRQRGYLLYFSAPRQSRTRESRIEKNLKRILRGRGLNDK